jgi:hypothetical protein
VQLGSSKQIQRVNIHSREDGRTHCPQNFVVPAPSKLLPWARGEAGNTKRNLLIGDPEEPKQCRSHSIRRTIKGTTVQKRLLPFFPFSLQRN